MDIYSIFMLVAIILFMSIQTDKLYNFKFSQRKYKIYCTVIGFLLFLLAALRSSSVGIDSNQYAWHFYNIQQIDFDLVSIRYQKDPIFFYFLKFLTIITSNHQWLFAIIGGLYAYSISRFIYRYSKDPMISFIILITMSYFAFSLTGLRQIMALSIILFSYDYIFQKHLLKFIFIVFLASLFHQSALLFLPAYFINGKKINLLKIIIALFAAIVIFIYRVPLIRIIQLFAYENYTLDYSQEAGGWTTLFVYFLIIIVALFFSKQIKNDYFQYFIKMMYVGALIQMFVPLQPNIFRVSMYFNLASIILIPDILRFQKDVSSKLITYYAFFVLMGIQYYIFTFYSAGVQPYKFFWQ